MKAVVLETRNREAALLLEDGTVRRVRGQYQVGQTLEYAEAAGPSLRQWAAAAAAMALLLTGSAGLWFDRNYRAYAEVSLDVNPSIVYTLNSRNRVLRVRAANDDAAAIVEALNAEGVRFDALDDALDRTLDLLEGAGYLDAAQADYVLVNVSADDAARRERLTEQADTALKRTKASDPTLEYRVDESDRATAREAEAQGMSAGRYAAWRKASASGDAPALEDFARIEVRGILAPEDEGAKAPSAARDGGNAAPGLTPDGQPGERDGLVPDFRAEGSTPSDSADLREGAAAEPGAAPEDAAANPGVSSDRIAASAADGAQAPEGADPESGRSQAERTADTAEPPQSSEERAASGEIASTPSAGSGGDRIDEPGETSERGDDSGRETPSGGSSGSDRGSAPDRQPSSGGGSDRGSSPDRGGSDHGPSGGGPGPSR